MSRSRQAATISYRAALRVEPFRLLWLSVLWSRAGEAIAQVAMPLLVYERTGSTSLVGLIFVLQTLPRALLAPFAGLLADRLDRRRIMLAAAILRTAAVIPIPLANQTWQIAGLAVIVSIGSTISTPAELSLLPEMLSKELLVIGLSLVQVTNSVIRVIGPAAGAALIGATGPNPAFWTEAALFVTAAAFIARMQTTGTRRQTPAGSFISSARAEIADGAKVVWRTPIVRGVTATESLWSLAGAAIAIAGLAYTQETLNLGDRAEFTYGLLSASMAAGAVTGALVASRAEHRIGRPTLMAVGYLGPLLIIPAVVQPPLATIFLCWFLFGFADAWAVIAMQAYLAESVEDRLRGRVYATWNGVIALAALIAYGAIGWITERLGAPWTIAVCGAIVGVGGPLLLVATGALADVRRQPRAATERI